MTNTFTQDQVLDLLADSSNIVSDIDKMMHYDEVDKNIIEVSAPIFIPYTTGEDQTKLELNFWVNIVVLYDEDDNNFETIPFDHETDKYVLSMSSSSNLIEGMTESETADFISDHLVVNQFLKNSVVEYVKKNG